MKEGFLEYTGTISDFDCKILFPTTSPFASQAGASSMPHRHYFLEIGFAIEGSSTITAFEPHKTYPVKPGEVLIIPANLYHSTDLLPSAKRYCFMVSFTLNNTHSTAKKSDYLHLSRIMESLKSPLTIKNEYLESVIRQCEDFYAAKSTISHTQIGALLTSYTLTILEQLSKQIDLLSADSPQVINPLLIARKEQLEHYFCDAPHNDSTIKQLADEMNLCERQVHSLIKKLYNKSYKDVLLSEKMKLATIYLEHTDKSLEEISWQLKYNSYSGFYTAFKNYFNCSPEAYRKRSKF